MYSGVPFVASFLTVPIAAILSDWLRAPGRLSTTVVRKIFCVFGFVASGCLLMLTGYFGCDRLAAVTTLFATMICICLGMATVGVNQLDLAPLHAGRIMALAYSFGNLGAIGAPLAMGVLTSEESTVATWQKVFRLVAAIYGIGAVVFLLFGSGERQSWADVVPSSSPAKNDDTTHDAQ